MSKHRPSYNELREEINNLRSEIEKKNLSIDPENVLSVISLHPTIAQTLLDSHTSGIFIQDINHKYLWANQTAVTNAGVPFDEIIGNYCYKIWENRESPCPECPLAKAQKTANTEQKDRTTPDGRHWSVTGIPIKNDEGQIIFFLEISENISSRKEQEMKLEESEIRFRNLAESTPIGILIYQGEYFVYANPACSRIVGYKPDELYDMHYWELVDHEHRSFIVDRGRRRLAGEQVPSEYQFQFRTKNGDLKWILINGCRIEFRGKSAGLLTMTDITERKHAEDLLEVNEKKYRALSDAAFEAIFISENGICLEQNEMARKIFGYSDEEAIGRPVSEWILPADRELVRKNMLNGHESPIEVKAQRKDGSSFPCIIQGRMMHYQDSSVRVTSLRDITEQKQAEAALRLSEDKYRKVFKTSPDAIAINRVSDGVYVSVNEGFVNITGYTAEEVTGKSSLDINIWKEIEDRQKLVDGLIKTGEVRNYEAKFLTKYGEKYGLMSAAIIMLDGEPHILNITRDITQHKLDEIALYESEERFRSVIQNVETVAVQGYSPDGTVQYWNHASEVLYGYSAAEAIGKNLVDLIIPSEMRPDVKKAVAFMTESGQPIPASELSLLNKDGSSVDVFSSHAVVKVAGRPPELFCIDVNLEPYKKALQFVKLSEDRYRLLFETSPSGIMLLDESGIIIEANEAIVKSTLYSRDELIGNPVRMLVDPQQEYTVMENISRILSGKVVENEVTTRKKDGTYGIMYLKETAITLPDGRRGILSVSNDITDRKKAELEVEHTQRRYQALIENSADGVVLIADGRFTYCSPSGYSMFGYKKDEMDILLPNELTHPDDLPMVFDTLDKLIKNPSLVPTVQYRFLHKNGEWRWIESTFSNLIYEPAVNAIVINFRDITERKKAETDLHDSEARYRLLAEHMTDTVWLMDMNLKTIYISPSIEKLRGFTLEDIQNMPLDKNLVGDSYQNAMKLFSEVIGKLKSDPSYTSLKDIELELSKKDGSTVWIECCISIIRDEKNFPVSILGEGRDITERKQAGVQRERDNQIQAALNEILRISAGGGTLDQNLDDVLNVIMSAPFLMEKQKGRIFLVDQVKNSLVLKANFGLTESQIKLCTSIPLGECVCGISAITRQIEFSEGTDPIHLQYFADEAPHSHYGIPVISEDKVLGVISVILPEGHSLVQFEVDFFRSVADILAVVIQRKLAEEALVKAKEKAEASDHLKTAFLNNISHEFRTPLNGILGFADFIVNRDLTEEDKLEFLGMINENSERLLSTVTNFMDSSLIASGNLEVKSNPFILNQLMLVVDTKYQPACARKNLSLQIHLPENTDKLILDSDQELIRKILMHLLDNALKFTSKGSIIYGYEIKPGVIEFFVKDTGIGISKDLKRRIFDLFIQGEVSNTRGYEGSGLGLNIAKGMTELLGGKIQVQSVLNKGSEFRFAIPAGEDTLPRTDAGRQAIRHSKAANPVILVAEDDHYNFLYFQTILADTKATVIHAVNGAEALDICTRNPEISLVLMDIKMPVMNGIEATRRIKASRSDLPIIAVTAYALSGDESNAMQAGCDDYLSKPIARDKLLEKIRKYVTI
jgi:PAS domain S-box-containing protein